MVSSVYPRGKILQLQYAMSSAYRRNFEAHNRSQAGAVQILEIREIERDAAPAQNQRLDNLADLSCVFPSSLPRHLTTVTLRSFSSRFLRSRNGRECRVQ